MAAVSYTHLGAGKSFSAKELIAFLMLHPDYAEDEILVCDPEGEFGALRCV